MLVKNMLATASKRLVVIGTDAPVRKAAALMGQPHTDIIVVCDPAGQMAGVLTKTDIVGQISRCMGNSCMETVASIMTRDVVACSPGQLIDEVWSLMKSRRLQRVPVIDTDGRPVGVIYARDALQVLMGEVEQEEALLRDYVMSVGYN